MYILWSWLICCMPIDKTHFTLRKLSEQFFFFSWIIRKLFFFDYCSTVLLIEVFDRSSISCTQKTSFHNRVKTKLAAKSPPALPEAKYPHFPRGSKNYKAPTFSPQSPHKIPNSPHIWSGVRPLHPDRDVAPDRACNRTRFNESHTRKTKLHIQFWAIWKAHGSIIYTPKGDHVTTFYNDIPRILHPPL